MCGHNLTRLLYYEINVEDYQKKLKTQPMSTEV